MQVPNYAGATQITVTERAKVVPGNPQAQPVTVVMFHVGTHGPFALEYPTATFDPNIAKADIKKKVDQINTLFQGALAPGT